MERKEFATLVVALFIVVILVAVGIWHHKVQLSVTTKAPPHNTTQTVSSTMDTAGWTTYVNTSSYPVYSIKYPSGWHGIYETDPKQGLIVITSVSSSNIFENNPYGSHELWLNAPGENAEPGMSLAGITPQTFSSYEEKAISTEDTGYIVSTSSFMVDGKAAFRYETAPRGNDTVDILIYESSTPPNEVLSISFDPVATSADEELFNAIVSTIHFLN